jgi:predicted nuclease with TOPRIM domain
MLVKEIMESAKLRAENQRLRAELTATRSEINRLNGEDRPAVTDLAEEIITLQEELQQVKAALSIYADRKNWTEYSLSLKRHWYWTDGTNGQFIAKQALTARSGHE